MRLVVALNFDFDGMDELSTEQVKEAFITVLQSGCESTCTDANVESVLTNDAVILSEVEYQNMLNSQEKLEALEAMGVDNWSGYSDAMRALKEGLEDFEWE